MTPGALLPSALLVLALLVWGEVSLLGRGLFRRDGTEPPGAALPEDDLDAGLYSGAPPSPGQAPPTLLQQRPLEGGATSQGPPRPPPGPPDPRHDWSIVGSLTLLLASLGFCTFSWCCRDLFLRHQLTFRRRPRVGLPRLWLRPFRHPFQPPHTRLDSGNEQLVQMEQRESSPPFLPGGIHPSRGVELPLDHVEGPQGNGDMVVVQRNALEAPHAPTSESAEAVGPVM